jgi:hypothetical protein
MSTENNKLNLCGCYMTHITGENLERLPRNHRSKVILHNGIWYFAEYSSLEQLRDFAEGVGFSWKFHHAEQMECKQVGQSWEECEPYTIEYYTLSHDFDVDAFCHDTQWGKCQGFWSLDELPSGVVPFIGLSNGSLVTCYAANDGEKISLYRPNPNAKEVYKPMTTAEHIAYVRKHGDMGPCVKGE